MADTHVDRLPHHAHDWASREVARWLRQYAKAELSTAGGMKPSSIATTVALICRNIADDFDTSVGKLSADLAAAERRVIDAAREGRPHKIREAIAVLDAAEAAIDAERRKQAVRRLGGL